MRDLWFKYSRYAFLLFLAIDGFIFITTFFNADNIWIEMLQAFALPTNTTLLVISIMFAVRRRSLRRVLAAILPCIALSGVFYSTAPQLFSNSPQPTPTGQEKLTILEQNVLYSNRDQHQLIKSIRNENPDIVALEEIDLSWRPTVLKKLSDIYPYVEFTRRYDAFGLAIFSKYPLADPVEYITDEYPTLSATVVLPQHSLRIFVTHIYPPTTQTDVPLRQRQFQQITQALQSSPIRDVIVMGDFNAVPWSKNIVEFKKMNNIVDSRSSFITTYPRWFAPVAIPIDYIFHSVGIESRNTRRINAPGSDHFGLITDVYLE